MIDFKKLADEITDDDGFIAWNAVVQQLKRVAAEVEEETIKRTAIELVLPAFAEDQLERVYAPTTESGSEK